MSYKFVNEVVNGILWIIRMDPPPLAIAMDQESLRAALAWGDCVLAAELPGEQRSTPTGGYQWHDDMASVMADAAVFVREAAKTAKPEELPEMRQLIAWLDEAAELGRAAMREMGL